MVRHSPSVPRCTSAFHTPRISLATLKLVICACPSGPWPVVSAVLTVVYSGGVYLGWVPGGVYRVGVLPLPTRYPLDWYCQGPTST